MMCQAGIFNNCNGSCDFCLIKDEGSLTMEMIYVELERVKENIRFIATQEDNWTTKFSDGISLLGGEIYFIHDEKYKKLFLEVIDVIIDEILLKSPNPKVKFSSVSNGNYDPEWLLFPTIDKIKERVGMSHVDMNFSYDLKYRFKNAEQAKRTLDTINAFHDRYNYVTGVQMILTQDVIDKMLYEGWRPSKFIEENMPGNQLSFLYPHPIHRGNHYAGEKLLEGFNFDRKSLMKALAILRDEEPKVYEAFIMSARNSAVYKYTMLYNKGDSGDGTQLPVLSDGKEVINPHCGHSVLYQCYSDTDKCMLCDLNNLW